MAGRFLLPNAGNCYVFMYRRFGNFKDGGSLPYSSLVLEDIGSQLFCALVALIIQINPRPFC